MTERGLPSADGAPACPFVAFEDDREARATSPDHRHRCYAELVPSPRAAAHQAAYCLSSAFPVCPTFQDWARREAAHALGEGERPRPAPKARPGSAGQLAAAADAGSEAEDDAPSPGPLTDDPPIRRNPPRDWAAPPPWASSGAGAAGAAATGQPAGGERTGVPDLLAGRADESRGLAGSAADRLAAEQYDPAASLASDEELAGLVTSRPIVERPDDDYPEPERSARRPSVSSTRRSQRERERERERDAVVGPSWERARRFEAYPSIRTRAGLPSLPRLAVLTVALAIAAVALFFLPALLGVGGGGEGTATPSPSASEAGPTPSPTPTVASEPTPQVYVVKSGDTMSGIASSFGLTLDELCAANAETVPDCNLIAAGDDIVIPVKPPDEFTDPSAEPS